MTRLPTPSSTWETGPGGTVTLVESSSDKVSMAPKKSKKKRAEHTCGACGEVGHNSRNKKCPGWSPYEP